MKLLIKDEHQDYWVMCGISPASIRTLISRLGDWRTAQQRDSDLKYLVYTANTARLVRIEIPPTETIAILPKYAMGQVNYKYSVQWSEVRVWGGGIQFNTKIVGEYTMHESRVVPWDFLQNELDLMEIATAEGTL